MKGKYWEMVLNDLIFLKHFENISFISTETMKENDHESILDEVTNRHTYYEKKTK